MTRSHFRIGMQPQMVGKAQWYSGDLMDIPSFFSAAGTLFPRLDRPWLILGKGPTFSKYSKAMAEQFYTLGLNHVGGLVDVDLTHVIDMDVLDQCGDTLIEKSRYLVMPWVPHVRHEATLLTPRPMLDTSGITLAEWIHRNSVLSAFARERRLLCYNLSTAPSRLHRSDDPRVVDVTYFSSSAAVDLLSRADYRVIRSLGVDGGTSYDQQFDKLTKLTLLANGRSTFDLQFQGITRTIMNRNIDFAPADIESPIRIFVGAEPEQTIAVKVLEHSIRKNATMSVRVEPLYQAIADAGIHVPVPTSPHLAPRTPFSYQRFAIPALKKHSGRAIYLDSDMQVFQDIKKLWTIPFEGAPLLASEQRAGSGRRPQYSVMLLDCEALRWDVADLIAQLEAGRWTYDQFMFEMAAAPGARAGIPSLWNDLERHQRGTTALTHYTDMNQQPWLHTVNPLAHLWCQGLIDAVTDGAVTRADLEDGVRQGHIRPSLLAQIEVGIADPLLLPRSARRLDSNFLPPHVLAAAGATINGNPRLLWRLRLVRGVRMAGWRLADTLGVWEGAKKLRLRVKKLRQDERIFDARRRRGMS